MRTKQTNSNKRFRFWARASIGFLSVLMLAAAPSQALSLPSTDIIDQSLGLSTPLGSADASVQDGKAAACADLSTPALPALPVSLPVSLPSVDVGIDTCVEADAGSAISDASDLAHGATDETVDQAEGIVDRVMNQVRGALDSLFSLF